MQKLKNEFIFRTTLLYDSYRTCVRRTPAGSVFSDRRKVLPASHRPVQSRIVPIPDPHPRREVLAVMLRNCQDEIRQSLDLHDKPR